MDNNRARGHQLTELGLLRLKEASDQWKLIHQRRCTQEVLSQLSQLDVKTVSKIQNRTQPVDTRSLEMLFNALGLTLNPQDHYNSAATDQIGDRSAEFIGRENAIDDLNKLVFQHHAKLIVIRAGGGVGKTTLAQHFLRTSGFDRILNLAMAKEPQHISSAEGVVEEWLKHYFQEEPARDFRLTLERLRDQLKRPDRRIGILIDNLEPALNHNGQFIEGHRNYVELLSVLSDPNVNSVTLVTTRERLREGTITIERYRLESLNLDAWKQFFQHRSVQFDDPTIAKVHKDYGGNAKAMEILRSVVSNQYDCDLQRYWRENQDNLLGERELVDLVLTQFQRLQMHHPHAHKLLCRLSCYRYQDGDTINEAGVLCFVSDLPERQRKPTIQVLRDVSLLESEAGRYWLHPVIRQEAIDILRQDAADWHFANITAAQFWADSVASVQSTQDALSAMQAFYHYLQIEDYPGAAAVIIQRRPNRWGTNESLGRSFYKLGLLQPLRDAIEQVKDQLPESYSQAKLYHLLGATHWLADDIHQAKVYCKQARRIAHDCLAAAPRHLSEAEQRQLKLIEINALLTLGICHLGLCDYAYALERHLQVEQMAYRLGDQRYVDSVSFYIAYLYCLTGNTAEAQKMADRLYKKCMDLQEGELPSWVTEYRLFYLGLTYQLLGEIEPARAVYHKILYYTVHSSYGQARAKALYGLAGLDRAERQFDAALAKHHQSIESLKHIGAMYDLGHAYLQLGLTYQAMGQPQDSHRAFLEAINVFDAVAAPKQVKRVRQAMAAE
jgi:tetratricopeptide (TPR) repeat protein